MIQGSAEWLHARCGKVTASRVADVIAKTKTGYGSSRANYMAELIAERLTGEPADRFTNSAMQWGNDQEPHARAAYSFLTGHSVEEAGFIQHPTIVMSGASPDGLVGDKGLVEIKCPNTATHIDTLLTEAIPAKYVTQMTWQAVCTGRAWCDFVSYDPRMPPNMMMFVKRLIIAPDFAAELETEVRKFLAEMDAKMADLRARFNHEEAA